MWNIANTSNRYFFNLVKRHGVPAAVVKLCGTGAGVVSHGGGLLQGPAVLEVGGDSGRPEAVVTGLGLDAGGGHAPADHGVGVALPERGFGQSTGAAPDSAEQRSLGVLAQIRPVKVGIKVGFEVVVTGHFVALASLLAQANPETAILGVGVLDFHPQGGADAGERVDHEGNQGAVAQARRSARVDAVQEPAGFLGLQDWRLAGLDDVRWPPNRTGGVGRYDLPRHQPVEQVADSGKALLHRGGGMCPGLAFNPGSDVQRLHGGQGRSAGRAAPFQELDHGADVGAAGVGVADVRSEELQKAESRPVPGGLHHSGQGQRRKEGDKLGHGTSGAGGDYAYQ